MLILRTYIKKNPYKTQQFTDELVFYFDKIKLIRK